MELLFDIPWYIPAGLAAGGVGVFLWANARLRKRERWIGIGIVGLAILLAAVSYFVDTPLETVIRQSRVFAEAVVAKDRGGMDRLLAEDASAFAWDKQEILDGAVYYADLTGLTGARIIRLAAEKEGNDLVSYLTVWSQHQGSSSFPVSDLNSQWKLEWAKDGEKWRIVGIVPLQIGQTGREAIERTYLDRPVPSRGR